MKKCPQCSRTYGDETLAFCLQDGALLSAPYVSEPTPVMPSPVQPPPNLMGVPSGFSAPPITPRALNLPQSYLIIVALALLMIGAAVTLIYLQIQKPSSPGAQPLASSSPSSSPVRSEPSPVSSPPSAPNDRSRFTVTTCNSIIDARTGLEWFVGPDRNMTWYDAQQWTVALAECAGAWRMPKPAEIMTLFDPSVTAGIGFFIDGRHFPAHIDPVFNAIGGGSWVWSDQRIGDGARSINLYLGNPVTYSAMNTFYSTRAFAVRGVSN